MKTMQQLFIVSFVVGNGRYSGDIIMERERKNWVMRGVRRRSLRRWRLSILFLSRCPF